MPASQRITTRNATFQLWQALLTNRRKRNQLGEMLVQGVRPISLAVEHGWPVRALLYDESRPLSGWARDLLATSGATPVAMAPELLAELGEKAEGAPELVAVVGLPDDDLGRVPMGADFLGVMFDRPTTPGNIGSVIRSADAFGAHGVIVTGHAADVYDPRSVRATTGSLFALPAVRAPGPAEVMARVEQARAGGVPVALVGTDEHGDVDLADADLTGPVLVLVGNETSGLSHAWRERCDVTVSIPMSGAASSLNAANAATVVLYEASRQRRAAGRGG